MGDYLLDTGPLVAYLDRSDSYHAWAAAQLNRLAPPLLTCEAVLVEACYLVRSLPDANATVLSMLSQGLLQVTFRLQDEVPAIAALLKRYANVPISIADACLVRMAEQHAGGTVVTLDRDFRIYRIHGRQAVPALMPEPT